MIILCFTCFDIPGSVLTLDLKNPWNSIMDIILNTFGCHGYY